VNYEERTVPRADRRLYTTDTGKVTQNTNDMELTLLEIARPGPESRVAADALGLWPTPQFCLLAAVKWLLNALMMFHCEPPKGIRTRSFALMAAGAKNHRNNFSELSRERIGASPISIRISAATGAHFKF
jgi:hypothetical protein